MFYKLVACLTKVFAYGFFKVNSGQLIFLFVILISYCFFINTVGDVNLISSEQLTFYHFIIVLTFISSPPITLGICLIWLIYAIKSWRYAIREFTVPSNQFLFYSLTSLNKIQQIKAWACVQSVIFLPMFAYWLFAMAFGIVYHHFMLPIIILLYILGLTALSAIIYTFSINQTINGSNQSYILRLTKNLKKPYFSLFIYQICDRLKLGYVISKIASYLSIIVMISAFPGSFSDIRFTSFLILLIVTAHSFLIYQSHNFEESRLSFTRNLPFTRTKKIFDLVYVYILLLLPETVWLFTKFNYSIAATTLLFGLSICLLYRSILYWSGLKMGTYLKTIFYFFMLFFFIIMFNKIEISIIFNILVCFLIFHKKYYSLDLEV